MTSGNARPDNETETPIRSNFDGILDEEVVAFLIEHPSYYAQHAAWNFCGYVWYSGAGWHEEVWRYKSPVEVLHGEGAEDVTTEANDKYGWE